MGTSTLDRVQANTADAINQRIQEQIRSSVERRAAAGPQAIERRLQELSEEWDIERYLETLAPSLTLAGLLLGLTAHRRFFAIPLVVQAFFLQHATQGWCPPVPILRRLGIRTQQEIEQERAALKAVRGDFRHVHGQGAARQALAAAAR